MGVRFCFARAGSMGPEIHVHIINESRIQTVWQFSGSSVP